MRYYQITIANASGQSYVPDPSGGGFVMGSGPTFTSYANNQNIPGALNIELDMPVTSFDNPQGNGLVRIWGVGLQMIGQAANLNGAQITIAAGMKKGLPLANPAQAGIIARGVIYQAYGNWQGINQTLDLIMQVSDITPPNGINFNWQPGTSLQTALTTTITQAFGKQYKPNINISSSLQPPNNGPQAGIYPSLYQFAGYLLGITQAAGQPVLGDSYPGVQITIAGSTINVFDGTQAQTPVNIAFQDLIGQPTWINPGTVNFKTVLRSDINVGTQILFPQGIIAPFALTSVAAAAPNAPSRNKTVFQGSFTVVEVHHFVNFRQPDADSWNTTFSAIPVPQS